MNKCLNCKTKTSNPKFCSRSCAATFNNKSKRKNPPKERLCSKCKTPFFRNKENKRSYLLCASCRKKWETHSDLLKTKTLKEYHELPSVKGKHPSWLNSHVRLLNRSWNRNLTKLPCSNCSYNKHVELCHIKAVTDFPETATLGEINAPENNKVLCRNCHWEYDHRLI